MWTRRSRTAPAATRTVPVGEDAASRPRSPWPPLTAVAPEGVPEPGGPVLTEPALPERQQPGTEQRDAGAPDEGDAGPHTAEVSESGATPLAVATEPGQGSVPDVDSHADPQDAEADFARRIERLLIDAGREASAMIVEARTTAAKLHAEATLQAQETVAAARSQAAAIVSEAYEQADEASVAARGMRAAAEAELAEARKEAEAVRQRAWEDSSKLRKEIDAHAQELLARTHRDVEMSLRNARQELSEIAARKADLDAATERLRGLVAAAVSVGWGDVESE